MRKNVEGVSPHTHSVKKNSTSKKTLDSQSNGTIVKLKNKEMVTKFKNGAIANMIDLILDTPPTNNKWNIKNFIPAVSPKYTRRYLEYNGKESNTLYFMKLEGQVLTELR